MWRFIILVSITPFLVGGFFANWFGLRKYHKTGSLKKPVDQTIQDLLKLMGREDIQIHYSRSFLLGTQEIDETLVLPLKHKESNRVQDMAIALSQLGLVLLAEKYPSPVAWRRNSIKTGYVLPVFVMLIVAFSCVIGKLPVMIGLATISISLGLSSILLLLSLSVEREAVHLIVSRIEKTRLFSRLDEEERVVSAIQATPWVSLIPGALLKIVLKG